MGVAIREDGGTLGVFSPKKVNQMSDVNTDIGDLTCPTGGRAVRRTLPLSLPCFCMLALSP